MKANLEFSLPEENEEHKLAVHAGDLSLVIWDMNQYLREIYKYRDEEMSKLDFYELLETIREEFWNIIEERGVSELVQ